VGERIKIMLNDGDMYVMSDKSVGRDWKQSSILTLRHAAGADKYLTINPNKPSQTKKRKATIDVCEHLVLPATDADTLLSMKDVEFVK